jgi:hypothetical protein
VERRVTTMTLRRLALVAVIALAIQGVAFAYYYDDLLFLRQPVDVLASAPPDVFRTHAARALDRSRLTRRHLETIAAAAQRHGATDIELRAAARRAREFPGDVSARLDLADALRRAGRYAEAEAIYVDILGGSETARP